VGHDVFATNDANAIMAALRAGVRPSEQEAAAMKRRPLIDELRKKVEPSDVAKFLSVMDGEEGYVAALHLSMLRHHAATLEVGEHLRRRWETASPFLRASLVWRILDDPKLPAAWHRRMFEFIEAELKLFGDVSIEFIGGPGKLFYYCLQRLGDSTFPETKKWVYLCNAAEAEEPGMARALVSLGLYLPDPFAREVAARLLARLPQPKS
jgi:hypothetical protein